MDSSTRRNVVSAAVSLGLLGLARPQSIRAQAVVRVAVAASFRAALEQIAAAYRQAHGGTVVLTFGATGNLARQIMQGAPFELFLAADDATAAQLAAGGLTKRPPELLVRGSISLVVPKASELSLTLADVRPGDAGGVHVTGLEAALRDGRIRRFAIANPELAPYGRAAREALARLGLKDLAGPRLVFGENVGQVAQYVATGAAEAGITATSLVVSELLASALRAITLPGSLHAPINQAMAVLKAAGPEAERFADFLKGADARTIFERNGFAPPR